jgi:hypothetical protein
MDKSPKNDEYPRSARVAYPHAGRDEWAVFDYKTGESGEPPGRTHCQGSGSRRRWIDLQLPLYRHLARAVRRPDGDPLIPPGTPEARIRLGYILLPRELERTGAAFGEWTDDELAEADEKARDMVRIVREGVYTFDPERAARHGRGPLAAVLGLGRLVAAPAREEDEPAPGRDGAEDGR